MNFYSFSIIGSKSSRGFQPKFLLHFLMHIHVHACMLHRKFLIISDQNWIFYQFLKFVIKSLYCIQCSTGYFIKSCSYFLSTTSTHSTCTCTYYTCIALLYLEINMIFLKSLSDIIIHLIIGNKKDWLMN